MSRCRRGQAASVFVACVIGCLACADAATLTVDPQGTQEFTTIQQALDAAAVEGDVIVLMDGRYTGDENNTLEVDHKTVTIRSANGPAQCIIDCEGMFLGGELLGTRSTLKGLTIMDGVLDIQGDVRIEDCHFVATSDDGRMPTLSIWRCRPTISGCTFTDGANNDGGSIHCDQASPIIRGCTFEGNTASDDGGAICNRYGSSPIITACYFTNNSSRDDGGAIANYENSHPAIVACIFESNRSTDNGGAIFSRSGSSPRIVSCTFAGNQARSNGGAIYNRENGAAIVNCVFTGNSANDNGGALFWRQAYIYRRTLLNCTLVGNTAALEGGAIYCENSTGPELLNCILWGNRDETGEGQTSQIFAQAPLLRYCCIEHWTGPWPGITNHNEDPLFVDADGADDVPGTADDNLRLVANSPCIDTGSDFPLSDPFLTDRDGYPRLTGPALDQGAYEYASPDAPEVEPAYPDLAAESVVVNEVLTRSPSGKGDWIELHNVTDRTVEIGGWFLTDTPTRLYKYEIAPGTSLNPHDYLVLYEDQHFGNRDNPGCHSPFAFNASGENVYLVSGYAGLLTSYRQEQYLEYSRTTQTLGRHVNSVGSVDFVTLRVSTPGEANGDPQVGTVVISEIMYNPPSGDHGEEYVELHNLSDAPIVMTGWEFRNNLCFDTPDMVQIPAQGRLLIAVDPATLRASYGPIPADVPVVLCRPWLGKDGDTLELRDPHALVERVSYSDGSHALNFAGSVDPWPTEADGQGASLTRIEPAQYGNEPASWQAAAPSPGW